MFRYFAVIAQNILSTFDSYNKAYVYVSMCVLDDFLLFWQSGWWYVVNGGFLVRTKVNNELVITNEYKSVSTDAHININIMLRMSDTKLKDDKNVTLIID